MTGEDDDYRALFAHVDVSDLEDWQTVALRLAERYVPELISVPPLQSSRGAPKIWDGITFWGLLHVHALVQQASRDGEINRDLSTDEAAFDYILNDPRARELRHKYLPDKPLTVENLRNVIGRARKALPLTNNQRRLL